MCIRWAGGLLGRCIGDPTGRGLRRRGANSGLMRWLHTSHVRRPRPPCARRNHSTAHLACTRAIPSLQWHPRWMRGMSSSASIKQMRQLLSTAGLPGRGTPQSGAPPPTGDIKTSGRGAVRAILSAEAGGGPSPMRPAASGAGRGADSSFLPCDGEEAEEEEEVEVEVEEAEAGRAGPAVGVAGVMPKLPETPGAASPPERCPARAARNSAPRSSASHDGGSAVLGRRATMLPPPPSDAASPPPPPPRPSRAL